MGLRCFYRFGIKDFKDIKAPNEKKKTFDARR